MGESNSVYAFNGLTEDEFRDACDAAVSELGGHLRWNDHANESNANCWTSHNGEVHAASIHWREYEIAKSIGARLEIPWINVRIQEGSLWDYSLYLGQNHLHNFSTLPEYWEIEDKEWVATQRGDPEMLAKVWSVDKLKIERYLRPWGYWDPAEDDFVYTQSGKAYEADRHGYRDIWQMTDFLRALGAHDPNWNEPTSFPRRIDPPPNKTRKIGTSPTKRKRTTLLGRVLHPFRAWLS